MCVFANLHLQKEIMASCRSHPRYVSVTTQPIRCGFHFLRVMQHNSNAANASLVYRVEFWIRVIMSYEKNFEDLTSAVVLLCV